MLRAELNCTVSVNLLHNALLLNVLYSKYQMVCFQLSLKKLLVIAVLNSFRDYLRALISFLTMHWLEINEKKGR